MKSFMSSSLLICCLLKIEEDLDEYEEEGSDQFEDVEGDEYEEAEEEEIEDPARQREISEYLVLRQKLKEKARKKLEKESFIGGLKEEINSFIGGLKEEIKAVVKMFKLRTLPEAF
ncbi:hypothetical protein Dimus_021466 [Dionaea muscipula]